MIRKKAYFYERIESNVVMFSEIQDAGRKGRQAPGGNRFTCLKGAVGETPI